MATFERNPVDAIRSRYAVKVGLLLGLVILGVVAMGGIIYLEIGDSLQESTESKLESSATLQAETLSVVADHTKDTARHVSSSSAVTSGDTDRISSYLGEQEEHLGSNVVSIHYLDPDDGTVIASTDGDAPGTDYAAAGAGWADGGELPEPHESVLTNPFTDPQSGAQVVGVMSAVPGNEDMAVVVLLDLEAQSENLGRPAPSAFTHVVDDEGTVVFSHVTDKIGNQNMGPADESSVDSMGVRRGLAGETGYVEMDMGNQRMTMGYAPVEGTDWVIMSHIPADEAYALEQEVSMLLGGLLGISLLGLTVVGTVFGRNTSSSLVKLSRKSQELESGNLDTELETGRSDEIGQLYESFDSMRDSLRQRIHESQAAKRRAEERSEELSSLAAHLERKAESFQQVMERAANGDLSRRMDEASESEAMTDIASEYNRMVSELSGTVDELSRFADDVAAHSEQVTAASEEVSGASQQVSESIQQISDDTEVQHDQFTSIRSAMEDVSATTEEIASLSNEVSNLAEQTADTGVRGRNAAESAVDAMETIDERSETAVESFERLREKVDEIEEIAEFISEVAGQTNMLALNANIEASRGEAGDEGFDVVAKQVKELAAESKESAEEIEELIQTVGAQTDQTADEIQRASDEIHESTDVVRDAAHALEEIAGYARETHDGVEEISAATEEQAASTEEVISMMGEAESASERVADEAQRVAAAAEEQTTALSEVTESASDLATQSRQLQEHLAYFETGSDEA